MSLKESVTLAIDGRWKFRKTVVMRDTGEIVLCQSVDILNMGLVFPLIKAGSLVIQVHQDAVLVAQLVHNVVVVGFASVN